MFPFDLLDQLDRNEYVPASAVALAPILPLLTNSVMLHTPYEHVAFSCILPGGQLYLDSQLAVDTDGSLAFTRHPSELGTNNRFYLDRSHQDGTALTIGGKSVDANTVPHFSLPMGFAEGTRYDRHFDAGVKTGDLAAVIYNNIVAYAVLADYGGKEREGHKYNLGEGSVELHRLLGNETIVHGTFTNAGIPSDVVTIVFPGTRSHSMPTRESIAKVAEPLFIELMMSGIAMSLASKRASRVMSAFEHA